MLARFSCLGKISSCTSFHLSRFMNKFSSWNRYKRPFQIWGVFIISWPFVFFLQISQVHISARTRTSYPAQLVSILARGFFSPVLAGWALSIQLWFWPGKHLWPLFGQLQLHSSLIYSPCNFKLLLNTAVDWGISETAGHRQYITFSHQFFDVINIDSYRVWLYRSTILLVQRFSNFSAYFHHIESQ